MKFFLVIIFIIINCGGDKLYTSMTSFPADGMSGGSIVFEKSLFSADNIIIPASKSIEILEKEEKGRVTRIFFRTTKNSGKVIFTTDKGLRLELEIYDSVSDADEDGFPDLAELRGEDIERFQNWFVRIAEAQYVKPNSFWNPKERDCAGLIRYSFREALKKHDETWFYQSGISLDKNLADVSSYRYPNIPVLGENIFKIKKGTALEKESFGTFANAETLFRWNTVFISKNIVESRRGDLLFFENRGEIHFPFHSMIVAENDGREQIVIYHTGDGSILKRVPISYLDQSKVFRVSAENPHFLGVFRFSILE